MPNPCKSFNIKRLLAAKERGRKMANRRWELHRERLDGIERAEERDPLRVPLAQITRRVIVILDERRVAEVVIRKLDSAREVNRKLAKVGLTLKRSSIKNLRPLRRES